MRKIEIEWSPADAKKALDDKTSFDSYIEFELTENKKLGVGMEIKYTEKSYPYTYTEKARLDKSDDSSPYYSLWNSPLSVFKKDSYSTLGTKSYKQYFRNHLLGLSMLRNGLIDDFMSVHLFPAGNTYQADTARKYHDTITDRDKETFKPITFEKFIATGKGVFYNSPEKEWLKYLQDRYII